MNQKYNITFVLLLSSLLALLAFNCSDIQTPNQCLQEISCEWDNVCLGIIHINCSGNCVYVQNFDSIIEGNGSLESPFSSLDQALDNTLVPTVIILIFLQKDYFEVSESHNLLGNITIKPFINSIQPKIQLKKNVTFIAVNVIESSPNASPIIFKNIILEPYPNHSYRRTFIFSLSFIELQFDNCIIQGFNNTISAIKLNYANFRFLSSKLRNCHNFSIIYETPSSTRANAFVTIKDSFIQNLTGQGFFEGNNIVQLQLYNTTISNIIQDTTQGKQSSWISMKELTSVDINDIRVVNSSLCFLEISLVSGGYLNSNLISMLFENIDLINHHALFKIYGTWNTLISNTKFVNIFNAKSILILEKVMAFSTKNTTFLDIKTSSGDFKSYLNVKLIGSLISTSASRLTFENCNFHEIISPAIYSQYSQFTILHSSFKNTQNCHQIISKRYSSLLVTESGLFLIDNVTFSGFIGFNGAVISMLGYPELTEKSKITNSIFENNKAENFGGVIFNENLQSFAVIENCSFINNSATSGGVIYVNPQQLDFYYVLGNYSIEVQNSSFQKNYASTKGGAIFSKDFVSLIETTFIQNKAMYGGAFYRSLPLQQNVNGTQDQIINCTFENNLALFQGGAFLILSNKKDSTLLNLEFSGNMARIYNDFFVGLPSKVKLTAYSSNKVQISSRQLEDNSQIDPYKLEQLFSSTNSEEISNYILQQNSGAKLDQILEVTVLDEEENIFQGIDGDVVSLVLDNCTKDKNGVFQSLRGETSLTFQNGRIHIYDQIELYGNAAQNCIFKIATNLESSLTLQETNFILDIQLQVSFFKCNYGEVFDKNLHVCKVCKPGTYSIIDPGIASECKPCPFDKAKCLGGNKIAIKPGYWRRDEFSDQILECPDGSEICLGSFVENNYIPNGKCQELREGGLCDECIKGYLKIDNPSSCINCHEDSGYYVSLNLQKSSLLKGSDPEGTKFEKISIRATLMKIHLNFLQALSLIARYKLKWPQRFNLLPIMVSETVPSHENALISKCLLNLIFGDAWSNHFLQLVFISLLPIFFWIIYLIIFFCYYHKRLKKPPFKQQLIKVMFTTFKTIAFIFQPIILQVGLRTFDCIFLPEKHDNKAYMREDHSIQCGSSQFYKLAFSLALPIVCIWGLLLPVALFCKIKKSKKDNRRFSMMFLFLANGKRNSFVWDYIIYGGKFILIVVVVFFRSISLRIQVLLTFLTMLILLYLQIRYKPYKDPKLNRLETMTFLILIFYVYSGLFFLNQAKPGSSDIIFLSVFAILIALYFSQVIYYLTKPIQNKIHPITPENQDNTYEYKDSQRGLLTIYSIKTTEAVGKQSKKIISIKDLAPLESKTQTPVVDPKNEQVFTYTEMSSAKPICNRPIFKELDVKNYEETPQGIVRKNVPRSQAKL